MCSRVQVVRDVLAEHAVPRCRVHHDHVIEALALNRTADAFNVGVLPWERGAVRTAWMFILAMVLATSAKTESRS
jgi:hypothetical protein